MEGERMLGGGAKDVGSKRMFPKIVAYTTLALAVGAMTFFGVCEPTGSRLTGPKGAAAVVAGNEVTGIEFRRAYRTAYNRYQQQQRDRFDPAAMNLSGMVLDQLVGQRINYVEATRSGIVASETEVLKVLQNASAFQVDGKFDGDRFDQFLRANAYTEESLTSEIRRQLTEDKFRTFVMDSWYVSKESSKLDWQLQETKLIVDYVMMDEKSAIIKVTDQDVLAFVNDSKDKIKNYFDANRSEFEQEEKIKARHILVSFEGARGATGAGKKRSKAKAKKKADDLLAQLRKNPAAFVSFVAANTDEASGKSNGGLLLRGEFFARDTMVKEFSDVAFKMKKGQISSVVESPFGFHIIKVEGFQPKVSRDLKQATNAIARKLIKQQKGGTALADLAKLVLEAAKSGDDKGIRARSLSWASTAEFSANARFIPGLGNDSALKEAVLSLKKGQTYPEILDINGRKYVLRLKSRKNPDMSKFDAQKAEELSKSARYMQSYTFYNTLNTLARKEYEKANEIWVNDEYRNMDINQKAQGGS